MNNNDKQSLEGRKRRNMVVNYKVIKFVQNIEFRKEKNKERGNGIFEYGQFMEYNTKKIVFSTAILQYCQV